MLIYTDSRSHNEILKDAKAAGIFQIWERPSHKELLAAVNEYNKQYCPYYQRVEKLFPGKAKKAKKSKQDDTYANQMSVLFGK